jgi:hypothetical protein
MVTRSSTITGVSREFIRRARAVRLRQTSRCRMRQAGLALIVAAQRVENYFRAWTFQRRNALAHRGAGDGGAGDAER